MERSILVAEDSRTQAERVRLLLEGAGYRVEVASNGREGLERVRLVPPDLILSDVVMPGMDGYAFCHAVKSSERTKHIPFVLLTERSTPLDILKGLERGADNFITKPFEDDHLLERIRRIFDHLDLRRQGAFEMEVTLRLGEREISINADKQQIVELLFSTFEELCRLNTDLAVSKRLLEDQARGLEAKVRERTEQLQRRLRESETLLAVSQAVSTSLDLTETVRRVAHEVGLALGADTVGAYVPGEEQRVLRPLAGYGVPEHLRDAFVEFAIPLKGHEFLVEAWETQGPVSTTDAGTDPRIDRATFERFPHRSLLFVPMLNKFELMGGFLAVWWKDAHAFTPEELRLADGIGRQAALALQNARLFAETEQARRAAESLAELGRVVSRSLDPAEVGQRIADSIRALLGAKAASLYRLEPGSGALVALAASGESALPVLPPATGTAGLAVRERRPVQTPDVLGDARITLAPDARARLEPLTARAVLAIPLLAKDAVIGSLAVRDRTGRAFSDDEVRLAAAFAVEAAIALDNAQLYAEATRRRREAEELARVARGLTESLSVSAVAERIVEGVFALLGVQSVGFRLLQPDGSLVAVAADPSGAHATPGDVLKPGMGISGHAVTEKRPVWTRNLLEDCAFVVDDEIRRRITASGLAAFLAVPLRAGDAIVGALSVADRTGREFSDVEIALLQTVADQAALALENARHFEASERRRREAEVLAELARSINASLELDTILHRLAEGARELCGSDLAQIALPDGDSKAMVARYSVGARDAAYLAVRMEPGRGVGGQVLATGRPFRTDRYADDPRITKDYLPIKQPEGVIASMAVPILIDERVEGLLIVENRADRPFTDRDEALLQRLADHAVVAIRNARLLDETKRAYENLSQTQAQLVQAQKMEAIGRLAGGIAHDFNNLLTVILGRSQMLLHQLDRGDPQRRPVKLIQQTAERAGALVQHLLAFSRKQVFQPKVLDLNAVVAGMDKLLRRLIGEDVELITVTEPDLGRVLADPAQLEQVILNLAVNARDAMPRGGRLVLKTANVELDAPAASRHPEARPGRYVLLEVTDTGIGMDAAIQARIFEPFFTTKEPGKGTGLGLATVFGIVRQSEGHTWVYSEPGKGSTFKVYLPRVDAATEGPGAETPSAEALRGTETILLVEDEVDLRDMAAEMLEARGYTVLKALSATEAPGLAAEHAGPIHLLLTDVVMPRVSGREVATRVTARHPETRVLYMSGYADEAISHHGLLTPGTALLSKPFTDDALARKVREVLDAPASRSTTP